MKNGGYDDGYAAIPSLWGREPGSLVRTYLQARPNQVGKNVFDLGCGEGKNAAAFANAGASVVAIDCSAFAIKNGNEMWPALPIAWRVGDVEAEINLIPDSVADVVVCYGLFHCLESEGAIARFVSQARRITKAGGTHIVVAFNDGPHDLSAHPGFEPTLIPHSAYLGMYSDWRVHEVSDSILYETHLHNNIPHFHSLTRLVASHG